MSRPQHVEIIEVGPRDGYQGIKPFIPTDRKVELLRALVATGIKRVEIGSFVSKNALPQMADTAEVLAACNAIDGIIPQVLIPSRKYGMFAMEAGADFLSYVLSVSDAHNQSNVRRTPMESAADYAQLLDAMPAGVDMRINIATAFDCPFDGRVAASETIALLDFLIPLRPEVEFCLCDTTGRATPDQVENLFSACFERFPMVDRWVMHAHDTYGVGLANVFAAWRAGVRRFDAAYAGLGGCPFAPGATGNVATEDLVWMFQNMGIETGINLDKLIPVSVQGEAIPGGVSGGRARNAMTSSCA